VILQLNKNSILASYAVSTSLKQTVNKSIKIAVIIKAYPFNRIMIFLNKSKPMNNVIEIPFTKSYHFRFLVIELMLSLVLHLYSRELKINDFLRYFSSGHLLKLLMDFII
jgi:hypothetical protein